MFRNILIKTFSKIPLIRNFINCPHKDKFTLLLKSEKFGTVHFHQCAYCNRVYGKFIGFKNLELRRELTELTESLEWKEMNKDNLIYTLNTWIKFKSKEGFKLSVF